MRPLARTLKKSITLAGIAIFGFNTGSAGAEVATAIPANEVYVSEQAAVVAAVNRYNPDSIKQDREYMGAIYQCDDGYGYSVGAGKAGAGNVTVKLRTPKGCTTKALWHTHGAAHAHHKYFSDTDTDLVKRTGLPFYMADYTGSLRIFEPGDRTMGYGQARKLGLGSSSKYARGTTVSDAHGHKVDVAIRSVANSAMALASE